MKYVLIALILFYFQQKLREKESIYSQAGHSVKFVENPFAVVILTPLMKRAHNIKSAKDIVFVDSTSSCDTEQHTITFFLTPCPAGAAPLGIVITKGQSYESYKAGFQLFKDSLVDLPAFGNQSYPKIFMTDNSDAETKALKFVWPESENALCKFHINQAVWRWLCEGKNALVEERQQLMYSFQRIMHANLADVEKEYENALSITENEKWISYLSSYWQFKEKWILAYRDSTIHGHHTNNFCEVCVRIFKDNVLSRVRVYNVVALIDFCCSPLEQFYVRKFKDFSNFRMSKARLFLSKTMRKSEYIKEDDITKLSDNIFIILSQKSNTTYTVDANLGVCTCPEGQFGRFCKHEAAIYKHYDIQGINFPPVTQKHRYEMAFLATGDKTLNEDFYQPLQPSIHQNNPLNLTGFLLSDSVENQQPTDAHLYNTNTIAVTEANTEENDVDTEALKEKAIELFANKLSTITHTHDDLLKFVKRLEKTNTEGQLASFLCTAGSHNIALRRKSGAYIGVQPTSKSRRRPQLTRGSKRFPVGRPPKGEQNYSIRKKKHRLAHNIRNNVTHAKLH